MEFTGTFLAPAEQITSQLGYGTEKSTMKMLRWGYVVAFLALLCVGSSASISEAAIEYNAQVNATWTIDSISNGGGLTPNPLPNGFAIYGAAFEDGANSGVLSGIPGVTADFTIDANLDPPGVERGVGSQIHLSSSVWGIATNPGDVASSEATTFGELVMSYETSDFINSPPLFVGLSVTYDIIASTSISGVESASTDVALTLTKYNYFTDTWDQVWPDALSPLEAGLGQTYTFDPIEVVPSLLSSPAPPKYRLSAYAFGEASVAPSQAAVPEPSTIAIWSLFGVVGLTVGAIRRRRK